MDKETATNALKAEYQLEKSVKVLQETLATPLSAEPLTHNATKAKQACEAINTATADLRNVLYSMFFKAEPKNNTGEQT